MRQITQSVLDIGRRTGEGHRRIGGAIAGRERQAGRLRQRQGAVRGR